MEDSRLSTPYQSQEILCELGRVRVGRHRKELFAGVLESTTKFLADMSRYQSCTPIIRDRKNAVPNRCHRCALELDVASLF